MKKTLLISIGLLILALLIAIPLVIKFRKSYVVSNPPQYEVEESLVKNINNIVEYNGTIPKATLEIEGKYSAIVNLDEIKDKIPVYEFEAGIVDIYGTHVNKYVGIKYFDLIRYLNVPNNEQTVFISKRKSVGYRPSEIDYDKTFIVFYMDGKPIGDSTMTLLAVNYNYLYSVEGLTTIIYE